MTQPLRFRLPISPRCTARNEGKPCDLYASHVLIAAGQLRTHCRLHIEGEYNQARADAIETRSARLAHLIDVARASRLEAMRSEP